MKPCYLITGMLSCLAIGAIAGILLAPDKGYKTRRRIAKKGNYLKDGIKGNIDSFVSSAENKYEEITSKIENVKNDLK